MARSCRGADRGEVSAECGRGVKLVVGALLEPLSCLELLASIPRLEAVK